MRFAVPENNNSFQNQTVIGNVKIHYQCLIHKWKQLCGNQWNWQLVEELKAEVAELESAVEVIADETINHLISSLKHQIACIYQSKRSDKDDRSTLRQILKGIKTRIAELEIGRQQSDGVVAISNAPTLQQVIKIGLLELDQSMESSIKSLLNEQGYQVHTYHTPSELKQGMRDENFDIVLIDFLQPDCPLANAISVEELLTNNPENIPIIMLAEQDDLSTRLTALRAGIRAYITKPLDKNELFDKIDNLLERRCENQIKVLMVDDDYTLMEFYQAALSEEGFTVKCSNQPLDILQHIETFQPDVLTLDYHMPECSGLEVAEILRGDPRYMKLPIIFMSADDEAMQKKGLISVFGDSFLPKPVDIDELCDALNLTAVKAKKTSKQIDHISVRQSFQHLQNRDYFLNTLEKMLQTSEFKYSDNCKRYLAMISVDNLDHLQTEVISTELKQMYDAIESYFSKHPLVDGCGCNFGEGTYLLLLEDKYNQNQDILLRGFHESFNREFLNSYDFSKPLSISIGAYSLNDDDSVLVEEIITDLENACISAANNGWNQREWIKPRTKIIEQKKTNVNVDELDNKIITALKNHSFQLAYQPIIKPECEDHLFEVLVRLVDEDGEVYLPDRFLPYIDEVLEDGYYTLDRWVIENAFKALENSSGFGSADFSIVIKLWPNLKQMERLLPFIYNMVSNSHLRGDSQSIYFTTSAQTLLSNTTRAKHILNSLHKANCGFIIDHWMGSDQSIESIANLEHVDFVKLDPGFNSRSATPHAIKTSIKKLRNAFNGKVEVIASLVEDAQTFAQFWDMDIRFFQGYFIHRPNNIMQQKSFEGESLLIEQ